MATRNTVQQKIIAEQLEQLGNHPTVDEVHRAVSMQRSNISKATVYRTLNKLADSGHATRVIVGNGAERFDHRADHHYHVTCAVCGRVDDVEAYAFPGSEAQETASGASGYLITGHDLQFVGICPACQRAEEKGVQ